MLKAAFGFFSSIREIQHALVFRVVNAAHLHGFEENTFRLLKQHLARCALIDARYHLWRDVARLPA